MGSIFEVLMLVCFGLSWPFNIMKSWKSRTAKGKSMLFELLIFTGYALGVTGKFINGNVNYVVIVYILDLLMVTIDLILTIRNIFLDHREEKRRQKELNELNEKVQEAQAAQAAAEAVKEEMAEFTKEETTV